MGRWEREAHLAQPRRRRTRRRPPRGRGDATAPPMEESLPNARGSSGGGSNGWRGRQGGSWRVLDLTLFLRSSYRIWVGPRGYKALFGLLLQFDITGRARDETGPPRAFFFFIFKKK